MGKRVVTAVNVVDVEKRRLPSKHYVYVILVTWSDGIATRIYRRYSVFFDFQCKLLDRFVDEAGVYDPSDRIIPFLPGKKYLGRSHVRKVALERLQPINEYCQSLVNLPPEIAQSQEVSDFFDVAPEDVNPPNEEKEKKWKADKISKPKLTERYVAVADYKAEKAGEVDLQGGMVISEVIEKSESGWWFVATHDTQGWAPSTYLVKEDGSTDEPVFRAKPGQEEKFTVTQNYTSNGDDELSVAKGEVVDVLEKHLQGWWLTRRGSQEGWVPATYLKEQPITHDRHSLSLASENVEVIGNLSEISQFFQKSDRSEKTKLPPPRAGSLPRSGTPVLTSVANTYVTIADFCDKVGDGVSFHSGESVTVLEKTSTGWWYIEIDGEEGWAPASYLESNGPNVSPKRVSELSSFTSDDSFTSEDASPQNFVTRSRPEPRSDPRLTAEHTSRPLSFDEALAGKAKTDCGGSIASKSDAFPSRQVGREARRRSGSVPTTPTDTAPEWQSSPVSRDKRSSSDADGRTPQFQLPVNEIRNLFGKQNEGGKPFALKQVDRSKINAASSAHKFPGANQSRNALPVPPPKSDAASSAVSQRQGSVPDPPKMPTKPSISGRETSDVKKVTDCNADASRPLPVRPMKPVIQKNLHPKQSSGAQISLKDVLNNQISSRKKSDEIGKPPFGVQRDKQINTSVGAQSVNKAPIRPALPDKSAVNKSQATSDHVSVASKIKAGSDLASALKTRLEKSESSPNKPGTISKRAPPLSEKPSTAMKPNVGGDRTISNQTNGNEDSRRENNIQNRRNAIKTTSGVISERHSREKPGSVTTEGDMFVVIGNVDGVNEGEISLREGCSVKVQQRDSSGWWYVDDGQSEGWAPMTYLEPAVAAMNPRNSSGLKPSKPPKPPKKP